MIIFTSQTVLSRLDILVKDNLIDFWDVSRNERRFMGSVGILDMLDAISHSLQSNLPYLNLYSDAKLNDLFLCRRLVKLSSRLSNMAEGLIGSNTGEIASQLLNESNMKGGEEID